MKTHKRPYKQHFANETEGDTMDLNPSPKVRAIIYILVVLGTAVVVPLNQAGIISDVVLSVWTSVSGAASLLAALNVKEK